MQLAKMANEGSCVYFHSVSETSVLKHVCETSVYMLSHVSQISLTEVASAKLAGAVSQNGCNYEKTTEVEKY